MIKIELYNEHKDYKRMRRYKIRLYSDGQASMKAWEEISYDDPKWRKLNMIIFHKVDAVADQLKVEGGMELVDEFFKAIVQTIPVDSLYHAVTKWRKGQFDDMDEGTGCPDATEQVGEWIGNGERQSC